MKKEAQKRNVTKKIEFVAVKEPNVNSKIKFVIIKNPPHWHRYKKYEKL